MAGIVETDRLPAESYTKAASDAVYRRLSGSAAAVLDAGWSVIVDAVFAGRDERREIEAVAREHGAAFAGLWLTAPVGLLEARVTARTGDASDADVHVVRKQAAYDTGEMAWPTLDASGAPEAVLAAALVALSLPLPEEKSS